MAIGRKLRNMQGLLTLLFSVALTRGLTTTNGTGTDALATNNTADLEATTTALPVSYAVLSPLSNESSAMSASYSNESSAMSASYSNIPADSNISFPLSENQTVDIEYVNQAGAMEVTSPTTVVSNVTSADLPPAPDDSNVNLKPDPLGNFTTPGSTQEPITTTSKTPSAAQTVLVSDKNNSEANPYTEDRSARPKPISPLTALQQQRLLTPFLFLGRSYFPQASANTAMNNFAPLYMTAMDLDLWPLLLAQQRPLQQQQLMPQQQVRSQQQLTAPQQVGSQQAQTLPLQRQSFPSQNRFPQNPNDMNSVIQNRNNMAANWWFLSEL